MNSGRHVPYVLGFIPFNLNKIESDVFANFTLTCDVKMKALMSVNGVEKNSSH